MVKHHLDTKGSLSTVDPVWTRIRDEAEEIDLAYEPGLEDIDDGEAIAFGFDDAADDEDEVSSDADFDTGDDDLVVLVSDDEADGR